MLQRIGLTPLLFVTVATSAHSKKDRMKRNHLRPEMAARWQVRREVKVISTWVLRGVRLARISIKFFDRFSS